MAFSLPPSPLSPSPLSSHPTHPTHRRTQSQTHIVTPSIKHTATRLQCLSNFKLRIESSRNDPRLRILLGHISIYDNIREYRQEQMTLTAFPPVPQSQRPPPRKQAAANELQEYLSLQQARVPSFQDFQAAIEMQLATLTEIQSASKRLQALSQSTPAIDEVEEYCDSDSDMDNVSDYDSYDGEGDWRDEEEDDGADSEDSMTDPESVVSECSSPVEEKDEGGLWALRPLAPLLSVDVDADF